MLAVGQPGDEPKRKADHVAELVTPMPTNAPPTQRRCTACNNENSSTGCACPQRKAEPSADSLTQLPITNDVPTMLQSGGQPLPAQARSFFEPRFGADFSQVRIRDRRPYLRFARGRAIDACVGPCSRSALTRLVGFPAANLPRAVCYRGPSATARPAGTSSALAH